MNINNITEKKMIILQAGKLALANASENLAGRMENRPGQVKFFIGYNKRLPSSGMCQKILASQPVLLAEINLLRLATVPRKKSISWLLMPWLFASPGHQQPWY